MTTVPVNPRARQQRPTMPRIAQGRAVVDIGWGRDCSQRGDQGPGV